MSTPLRRVTVLGHKVRASWRLGRTLWPAQQVAFQHRRRCRRLVLVSTATPSVHADRRVALITEPHGLAPVVTDFLLS